MKKTKVLSIFLALALLLVAVIPASAQLGDTDVSSFTVQNVSGGSTDVTVTFYAEDGTPYTPTQLDADGLIANPFTLADGASQQVYVPSIPEAQLPSGRYAVVISSTGQVVAQAGVAGTGSIRFSGSYIGFSAGASPTYLPSVAFNFASWYSMISVQNLGTSAADVVVTITCADGNVGTLTQNGVPANASYTWALKNTTPTGFTASTQCDGSAEITANQPIVAVNNQNKPTTGATNTFEGAPTGAGTIYIPSLSNDFAGWNSALTIRKLSAGTTTVTVVYNDGDPNDVFDLTDASPSKKLYMPTDHVAAGRFGATITASGGGQLLAVVGTTKGGWSGATSGVLDGSSSGEVAIPNVAKAYGGWKSAINCQNVGATATTLHVEYAGYAANAYDTITSLNAGDSVQIAVFNEAFLPNTGWQGGATITANAAGALIACTVGNSNPDKAATNPGDWTSQYNAYNK
ncbi:MAG: hypothetical protein KKD28_00390 [Chloroflexi bacterium]|nr:hypothetical protein [Chloroflexota bacterium]MBU1659912.1 hypothetical protein [Chloroflexota bacterium]